MASTRHDFRSTHRISRARLLLLVVAAAPMPAVCMAKDGRGLQDVRAMLATTLQKRHDTGDTSGVEALEHTMILATEGRANRQGNKMTLRFSNGKSRTYITKGDCETLEGACQRYTLIALVGIVNYFLVEERFYERIGCLIVDSRSGRETELPDIPYLSPNGDRFLVVSGTDGGGAYWPLQIWRRRGDTAFVEWKQSDRPPNRLTEVIAVEWKHVNRIDLTMASAPRAQPQPPGVAPTQWAATLTLANRNWSMKPIAEP